MHEQMLRGYRVLDLGDEKGVLCTKIMADLGADVITIEPPGGHPTRAVANTLETTHQAYDFNREIRTRFGHRREAAAYILPCQDGYIALLCAGQLGWSKLVPWMQDEDCGEVVSDARLQDDVYRFEHDDQVHAALQAFFATKTKQDIYTEAQRRRASPPGWCRMPRTCWSTTRSCGTAGTITGCSIRSPVLRGIWDLLSPCLRRLPSCVRRRVSDSITPTCTASSWA